MHVMSYIKKHAIHSHFWLVFAPILDMDMFDKNVMNMCNKRFIFPYSGINFSSVVPYAEKHAIPRYFGKYLEIVYHDRLTFIYSF
jgi:hypothetical protein